jgi:PAS domain S-box-containing protein
MNTLIPDNAILGLALKSISDCVCISDMNRKIIFVNDAFIKMYGYSSGEIIGRPLNILLSEQVLPETVAGIFPATIDGGWCGELIHRRKDGTEFPLNIAISAIRDDQEKPVALMGISKDITETKQMQAKFRTVADLFQKLGTDTSENIKTIVTCACNVIGGAASLYTRLNDNDRYLVVMAGHDLPPDMNIIDSPDGHICYEATIKGLDQTIVLGDLTQTPYMQSDPNVARFGLMSYLGAPVMLRGKTVGSVAVVDLKKRQFHPEEIDLIGILARALSLEEERQDAIRLLETSVFQSPSGILIADAPDVKIRIVNARAMAILTGNDAAKMKAGLNEVKRSWNAFTIDRVPVPIDDLPLSRAIRHGEITENLELILRAENGVEHIVSANAAPVRNADGIITSAVVMFHDITARKQTEQEFRESEVRLRTLINAMPDIVCFKDGDGRWLEANDSDLKLFELEGVEYKGKKDSELAIESEFYRDAFLACEESDEKAWELRGQLRTDETIPCHDGTSKVFDLIKIPTFDDHGKRKGLIVVGRDITERQLAEKTLQHKATELERYNSLMVGRELKMIELKKEINELLIKAGMPEKYMIHE